VRVFYPRLRYEQELLYVDLHTSRGRVSTLYLLSGKRALGNSVMSTVDSKIKQYEDKFKELKLAFQDYTILQTGITVSRMMGDLESVGEF